MNEKIWFVCGLVLMLAFSSVAFAAEPVYRGFIGMENVEKTSEGTVLNIGVLYTEDFTVEGGTPEEIYKAVQEACSGRSDYAECVAQEFEARTVEGARVETHSTNAKFVVDYYNPISGTWSLVPGCGEVTTDESRDIEYYDTTITYYYATCTVPNEIYEGMKTTVRATLVESDVVVDATPQTTEVSDVEASPAGIFSTALTNLINAMTSTATGIISFECPPGETCPYYTLPCAGVFLIIGLLLASMYFSGKSPITLLDITSPRLPAPKGVGASGQVMLPYGYGEMKKGINRKMAAAAGALTASRLATQKKMGYNPEMEKANKDVDALLKSEKAKGEVLGGGKQAEEVLKSIATGGVLAGKSAKDMGALLNSLPYHYGDKEHKELASILDRLKKMGGREALMADTIKDYMLSMRTMQTMDALSGHPTATSRSALHARAQTMVGKLGGTNRYPILGVTFAGSFDSAVRSAGVVHRGHKAIIAHAPDLARGVARTTMEMVGGPRAMEKVSRKKPEVAAWLKKPGTAVELGQMFPVDDKMGHLYNTLKEEVTRDESKYILKQLYKKMGVNFAVTEETLAEMGYKDMNILDASGYNQNKSKILALEKELQEMVFAKGLTGAAMRDELLKIAQRHGAEVDHEMMQFNKRLADIDASKQPDYVKFLQLQEELVRHQSHVPAAGTGQVLDTDKFYTVVGRPGIRGSDIWDTFVLRSMVFDAENGHLKGGLKEELQVAWLRTVNRMSSLKPTSNMEELPAYMRNPAELAKLEKRVAQTLGELLTDEGKQHLTRFTGKTVENATVDDHMAVLYGGKSLTSEKRADIEKQGRVPCWGDEREMGSLPGSYKVMMDELWLNELNTRESIAIHMWTEGRFKRSYIDPYDATVEANLDRRPDSAKWSIAERTTEAKKEWANKLIAEDMEQRFNSHFALNAYGKTHESAAFYSGVAAGFLEKALVDKGLDNTHPDLVFARSVDVSSPSQLKKLQGLLGKYQGEFEHVIKKPVTYDDIYTSKQAMVMLQEGGFAFAHKGMPLGSGDRTYGVVTMRNPLTGRKEEFSPEEVAINFKGNDKLQMEFYKARESKDPKQWTAVMDSAYEWSKTAGYEGKKVFAALVWEYGNNTYDYQKYYAKTSLEITPKREAIPLAPDALRMFGVEGGRFREALKPWRDLTHDLGNYIGKVALTAGGPVYRASYDVTPVASYLRLHSWRLAADIYTKDYSQLTSAERRAYEKVGIAHFEYHQAYDWAIDRNPMRRSTAHGLQQSMESSFQYGPRGLFATEDYIGATMTKGQWKMFRYGPYAGALSDLATKMHQIPTNMFGGMQMAMQGYPSRWDQTGNPLKPWDYVSDARLGEAVKSLNPFSFDWAKSGIGKAIGKTNVWEGSLQKRQLAGPDIMAGLAQPPQDIFYKNVGVYAAARIHIANPNEVYMDYRYKTRVDPALAEWMVRNKDAVYMYDKTIRDQALSNVTRRTVSIEALQMRRSQELRQFGLLNNSTLGWASAPGFIWHMPLPFLPPQWSPREQFMKAAKRAKYGGGMKLDAWAKEQYRSKRDATVKFMKPWMGSMVSYCRYCGRSGYKGSTCICGKVLYGS